MNLMQGVRYVLGQPLQSSGILMSGTSWQKVSSSMACCFSAVLISFIHHCIPVTPSKLSSVARVPSSEFTGVPASLLGRSARCQGLVHQGQWARRAPATRWRWTASLPHPQLASAVALAPDLSASEPPCTYSPSCQVQVRPCF